MELSRYHEPGRIRRRLMALAAALVVGAAAVVLYFGLTEGSDLIAVAADESAIVEPIGKTGVNRVVLMPSAAKRLDIKTTPVSYARVNGKRRTVIPYAAVLYDPTGDTWAYTSPKPLVFVRHELRVNDIKGALAVLSEGPRVGARIVAVGSAELWGIEYGDIEED